MLREFDERNGWSVGFRSCAHWLNWRTGLDLGAAREKVRVARALADLPVLSAAMERGELSYSKVRALTRVATPGTEQELLHFALDASATRWRSWCAPGGEVRFRRPSGDVVPDAPALPPLLTDPVTAFEELLAAEGVEIDGPPAAPSAGYGLPVDYGWAVDWLISTAAAEGQPS